MAFSISLDPMIIIFLMHLTEKQSGLFAHWCKIYMDFNKWTQIGFFFIPILFGWHK